MERKTVENLVFLDIDGVLTNEESYLQFQRAFEEKRLRGEDVLSLDVDPELNPPFAPAPVYFLNRLYDMFDIRLVISSSWRCLHPKPWLVKYFKDQGVKAPVIGFTPERSGYSRCLEIHDYLQSFIKFFPDSDIRFVIIDDSVGEVLPGYNEHLVKTKFIPGFDKEDFEKVIEILNKE